MFTRKLKKKNHPAWIVNPQTQLLRIRLFGILICRLGIVDFNLPSNWWVSQLQKSEFAVLLLGFEKLGLEVDNRGQTTKNDYRRIYGLCFQDLAGRFHSIPKKWLDWFWEIGHLAKIGGRTARTWSTKKRPSSHLESNSLCGHQKLNNQQSAPRLTKWGGKLLLVN